jgi:hypothetical protein
MTMPSERTRSVIQAREFLIELRGNLKLPESVRNEAHRLLRHYPSAYEMNEAARQELENPSLFLGPVFGFYPERPDG